MHGCFATMPRIAPIKHEMNNISASRHLLPPSSFAYARRMDPTQSELVSSQFVPYHHEGTRGLAQRDLLHPSRQKATTMQVVPWQPQVFVWSGAALHHDTSLVH